MFRRMTALMNGLMAKRWPAAATAAADYESLHDTDADNRSQGEEIVGHSLQCCSSLPL